MSQFSRNRNQPLPAAERSQWAAAFAGRGLPPGEISRILRVGRTRREIADDLIAWLRARPKRSLR